MIPYVMPASAFVSCLLCCHLAAAQSFNPSILQDTRDLPKTDGTFGFLYRTEDGIAAAAKGDSDGVIHGRFSYTDPTGLKVNINYNAGSRVAPGYNYNEPSYARPQAVEPQYDSAPQYREPPRQYQEPQQYRSAPAPVQYSDEPQYILEPRAQPKYSPQTRQSRPRYSSRYREPLDASQTRRTRPPYARQNEVYNDDN